MSYHQARGQRIPWEALPASVRDAVETGLGTKVVGATTQPGGMSPGVAARLELADGNRAFVKAVGSEPNPYSPGMHRREAEVAAALPAEAPAPRLLFAHDDGNWVALVFEDVEGHQPAVPWRPDELERVLAALTDLAEALTPAPVAAPTAADYLAELFGGWSQLAQQGGAEGVDPWATARLDELARLEAGWAEASIGETLLHADVRSDNVLLTEERVVFVDWPHACLGAAWLDLAGFLPSLAMQGGPRPWEVFEAHPLGRNAPLERVLPLIAAFAGFFVQRSTLPPPPGLATLREFQRAQSVEALAWLRRSLGES
ncbi:MAG TPA: aminoglycoside phosphotransferase family protein [Gaiellaceae bacterium]|nr:aminoglycoside phosphotransferase family protein [Gaiellaceae bacterium]